MSMGGTYCGVSSDFYTKSQYRRLRDRLYDKDKEIELIKKENEILKQENEKLKLKLSKDIVSF